MKFKLSEMFLVGTILCIATAAIARLPDVYLIYPVGLTTGMFVIIRQYKVAIIYGSCFAASWCLVTVLEILTH